MYVERKRRVGVTTAAVEKQESISYSERVFATLVFQHAMRKRHVICRNRTL